MARVWASQHVCAALQCRACACPHPLLRLSCACPSFCECDANASLVRLDMRCFEEHSDLPDGSGKCRRRAPMPCCPWHPINVAQPRWCRSHVLFLWPQFMSSSFGALEDFVACVLRLPGPCCNSDPGCRPKAHDTDHRQMHQVLHRLAGQRRVLSG